MTLTSDFRLLATQVSTQLSQGSRDIIWNSTEDPATNTRLKGLAMLWKKEVAI